jgi:hypothetical protein
MLGRTLAHFHVEEKIGAGGMGEVYRAVDTRLDREVAIKVLPEALASDPDRLRRMQREARLLASLSHPNIAAIHGMEESERVLFLVLELIRGETLGQRLARGRLPVGEALAVFRQIAEALEAAHEKGIVHRDLKPGNVMLTPEGKVKVLDFGLARAFELGPSGGDPSESRTLSAGPTRAGVILGTAAYMSPEQARGQPLDARTDIWAFGCVLYEALSGRRAFEAETTSETMAALLTKEPDWGRLPQDTPYRIRLLLRRCVKKDLQHRLRHMGDARIEIEEATGEDAEPTRPVAASRPVERGPLALAALGLATLAFAAGMWLRGTREDVPYSWSGELLVGGSIYAYGPRVSPDGQMVAFQVAATDGPSQVAVMKLGAGNWSVLTHERSRGPVLSVSWSLDGTRLYFHRPVPNTVYSVPVVGGEERVVLQNAMHPAPLPDGGLLVEREEPDGNIRLYRSWPATGRTDPLGPTFLPLSLVSSEPRVFPDGKEAAYLGLATADAAADAQPAVHIIDITSGRTRRLFSEPRSTSVAVAFPTPIAIDREGRSVITALSRGDLHLIVAIPREGGPPRTILSLTRAVWTLDAGPDGSLFVDQVDVAPNILRFAASGGRAEKVSRSTGSADALTWALQLPDGRLLFSRLVSGRSTALVARPGGDSLPFVETEEETAGPACLLGDDVALLIGTPPSREIAIATKDGRILRRLAGVGGSATSLSASPDAQTLYFAAAGTIWAVPGAGGARRKVHPGDGVSVDPASGDLIVQLRAENLHSRFLRVPAEGGQPREIAVRGGDSVIATPLGGNAVRRDGRLPVTLGPVDAWFTIPGMLDLRTGIVQRIPLSFEGDVFPSNWGRDGSVLGIGWEYRMGVWRFRRAVP